MVGQPIPDGLSVLHACDNRACCNPLHLFLGTHSDNSFDMVSKGRSMRGARHPNSVLDEHQAAEIYRLRGTESKSSLALRFGVSKVTIRGIWSGRRWGHLTGAQRAC